MKSNDTFRKFSNKVAEFTGSSMSFTIATCSVVLWAISGPYFNYSDHWEIIINTSTTIVTFLMVFIIQNAQNRDSKAIHLKLNEIIKGIEASSNILVNIEDATDEELEELHSEYKEIKAKIKQELEERKSKSL